MSDELLAKEIDSFIDELKQEKIDQVIARKLPEEKRLMAYYRALYDDRETLLPLFRSYKAITGKTHIVEMVYECAQVQVMRERYNAKQAVMSASY